MRSLIKHTKHGFKHKPFHMTFLGVLLFGGMLLVGIGAHTITTFADPQPPFNMSPPSRAGTAAVGQNMTAFYGSWGGGPTSYTYQWRACDSGGANCSDISGATDSTYVLQVSDSGGTVRAVVTAHNADGEDSATTDASNIVQAQLGDLNSDGIINLFDLGILVGHLGACSTSCANADLDSSGTVDDTDLGTLLGIYQP